MDKKVFSPDNNVNMNIWCVVVTYNGEKWIHKCLNSLRKSIYKINIIVVDNASTDSSHKILSAYSDIVYIAVKENLGFGKANNIGIEYALQHSVDYILLLNQDAWIEPDMVGTLIHFQQQEPVYQILSPLHLNGRGDNLDKGFATYTRLKTIPEKNQILDSIIEVWFINAAIWLVKASLFLEIGVFDPAYPHYGEDVDFVKRLQYHGYKIGYSPHVRAYHDRENRKLPSSKKLLESEYIYFLRISKDINISFLYAIFKVWKETIWRGIKKKMLISYFQLFNRIIQHRKEILYTRKLVKEKGAHFMTTNKMYFKEL